MSLARAMVGVLAYDDDLGLLEGALVEGIENLSGWRVDGGAHIFAAHKLSESDEVVLLELGG